MSNSIPEKLYHISLDKNLVKLTPKKVQIYSNSEDSEDVICACPKWWMCVHLLPPLRYFQKGVVLYIYEISHTKDFVPIILDARKTKEIYEYRSSKEVSVKLLGELNSFAVNMVSGSSYCQKCNNPKGICDEDGCLEFPDLEVVIEKETSY